MNRQHTVCSGQIWDNSNFKNINYDFSIPEPTIPLPPEHTFKIISHLGPCDRYLLKDI